MDAFGPLVTAQWLHSESQNVRIVDVRWRLSERGAGERAFANARIPGAVFLDIDRDLSDAAEAKDRRRGRHPLPSSAQLSERLAAVGIGRDTRVVAYDDAGGMHAARLWWLVRYLGGRAAVLDGGLPAWTAAGFALETGAPTVTAPASEPLPPVLSEAAKAEVVDKAGVRALVAALSEGKSKGLLLDARAPERYAGEVETMDARAGHIPFARNVPATVNLVMGKFRDRAALRAQFEAAGVTRGEDVIAYCGSGVTACHDLLALELAGFPGARLYAGSWSEWSADPAAPIEAAGTEE